MYSNGANRGITSLSFALYCVRASDNSQNVLNLCVLDADLCEDFDG